MGDVVVIGAGMAGLVAARVMAERGLKVVVLEARNRVGGRVFSRQVDGLAVELGAEFVHGRPPELWALIDEAGVEAVERDGTTLRAGFEGGVAENDPQHGAMFDTLEKLRGYQGEDRSFAEYIAATEMSREDRAALVGYVEGFNAADANVIGVRGLAAQQEAEDSIDGDRIWHVRGGYEQLAEYLAERVRELGGDVRLGETVRRIEWERGRVQVQTAGGDQYAAAKCVVTLPLGVLQAAVVQMVPEPLALLAARRLAMGHVVRFTVIFRRAWWEDAAVGISREKLAELSFLFTPAEAPAVWWTAHPEPGRCAVTGWVGGPRAAALAKMSADDLAERACGVLGRVFEVAADDVRREIVSVHAHDWSADAFARGAYSYVPAGAIDAPQAMAVPEEGTIFFAGEHTDVTGHWGTVHAAMRSGLRAAEQVLVEAKIAAG